MKKLFVQFFLMLVPMMANADAVERNGFTYELNLTSNTASITKYSRSKYTGNKEKVVIPSIIVYNDVSYSVTSIGENVFYHEKEMKTITIPNSVYRIGSRAFEECEKLALVDIPNSVEDIGQYSFSGCKKLKKVTIGTGVKRIMSWAFYMCE